MVCTLLQLTNTFVSISIKSLIWRQKIVKQFVRKSLFANVRKLFASDHNFKSAVICLASHTFYDPFRWFHWRRVIMKNDFNLSRVYFDLFVIWLPRTVIKG